MVEYRNILLVVDDDARMVRSLTRVLKRVFEQQDVEIIGKTDPADAEAFMEEHMDRLAVVCLDHRMPGRSGAEILRAFEGAPFQFVVLTGAIDQELLDAAEGGHVFEFIEKGEPTVAIANAIRAAFTFIQHQQIVDYKVARARERLIHRKPKPPKPDPETGVGEFHGIVGSGPWFEELVRTIQKVAASTAPVFVSGESGVGKELVARALHAESPRRRNPFIAVNCAAIPGELLEVELFGYKKGAFTGADADKQGMIEAAKGGTLFLDEITEMPAQAQSKLLRFLQEGTIQRVGDTKEQKINVRVVAATNRDLQQAVQDGQFREDLYFRLNVIPVMLPPLRERRDDIPALIQFYARHFAETEGFDEVSVSPDVIEQLSDYRWPGNIRELRNLMHRLVLFSDDGEIRPEHLPPDLRATIDEAETEAAWRDVELPRLFIDDRSSLEWALEISGNDKEKAARLLGISRATLYRRLRKFDAD